MCTSPAYPSTGVHLTCVPEHSTLGLLGAQLPSLCWCLCAAALPYGCPSLTSDPVLGRLAHNRIGVPTTHVPYSAVNSSRWWASPASQEFSPTVGNTFSGKAQIVYVLGSVDPMISVTSLDPAIVSGKPTRRPSARACPARLHSQKHLAVALICWPLNWPSDSQRGRINACGPMGGWHERQRSGN